MDGRVLGARGHDDEIAIPRLETLEPGEELVPLGSTLRPAHPLLGVASRKVERVDERLLALAGFLAALGGHAEQHARGGARVEGRLEIRGARRGDERVASRGRVGVEQTARSVESPRRRARQHAHLLLAALGRLRGDPLPHRALREAAERDELAAREDRRRQRAELAGDEHDHRIRRRLLQVLEQRVRGVLVHAVCVENEVDPPVALERPHVQVVPQRANVVDADHLAERLEEVQVGMRARQHAPLVAEQHAREGERRGPLPHARRPVEQVRVRATFGERGGQEALRLELLRYGREGIHTPPRRARRAAGSRRGRRSARGSARPDRR